jgi:AcrR family transcriptional regulator
VLPLTPAADPPVAQGLREQKKHRVRTAVVEAALELFAERGFEATTVRDIAARAGVSTATATRYFPTKEAMLFPEAELRTRALYHAIRQRPEHEQPFEAVLGGLSEQPPADQDGRAGLLASRRAMARSAVARGRAAMFLNTWRDAIASALRDRGTDRAEAGVIAAVAVAVLDTVAEDWARQGGNDPLQPAVMQAFRSIGWTRRSSG